MGKSQNSNINCLEKLIPVLMDDLEGYKISVKEWTIDMVEIGKELDL